MSVCSPDFHIYYLQSTNIHIMDEQNNHNDNKNNHSNMDEEYNEVGSSSILKKNPDHQAEIYDNVYFPTKKIQCEGCRKDISKHTKIIIKIGVDYCAACFAKFEDLSDFYHVINKLDYPIFDVEWSADEELLLFEGLEKHGFGNWTEIAEFMGTNKTREEIQMHYTLIFLDSPDFVPNNKQILSCRDPETNRLNKQSSNKIFKRKSHQQFNNSKNHRGHLTLNITTSSKTKTGTNPAEIIGYIPRRGDFEIEYDNQAELLLAEMEFNEDDTEEEKDIKFRLIEIYNYKLTERIRRKQFVISRNLLDPKETSDPKPKEQKDIYNMMRYFARFNTPEDHEKLVQGIIREKQIRQRIEELRDLKRKGYRTINDGMKQLENRRKKQEKMRMKGQQWMGAAEAYKQARKNQKKGPAPLEVRIQQKRSSYLGKSQEQLCNKLNIAQKNYLNIKNKLLRQSIKQGMVERDPLNGGYKINRCSVESIFDFLVEKEEPSEQRE